MLTKKNLFRAISVGLAAYAVYWIDALGYVETAVELEYQATEAMLVLGALVTAYAVALGSTWRAKRSMMVGAGISLTLVLMAFWMMDLIQTADYRYKDGPLANIGPFTGLVQHAFQERGTVLEYDFVIGTIARHFLLAVLILGAVGTAILAAFTRVGETEKRRNHAVKQFLMQALRLESIVDREEREGLRQESRAY